MKTKFMRSLLAVLGIGALLVALVAYNPSTTTAANLTGGQYTYLIDGEEVAFTFDPIAKKDGLLLPTEVFQKFDVIIEGGTTRNIILSKGTVRVNLTIGSTVFDLGGQPKALSTAPIRLNGRVFLPSELLREFGVDFTQDGNFISMRGFTDKYVDVKDLSTSEWGNLKGTLGFNNMVKLDSGVNVNGDFWMLTPSLITASNLNISYGNRARLLGLFETNSLVLVNLSNVSNKAGALVTATTYLIDDQRNQYDVQSVIDIGYGLLNSKLAPSADRLGVLVFPKLPASAVNAILYYDTNGYGLGTFRTFR